MVQILGQMSSSALRDAYRMILIGYAVILVISLLVYLSYASFLNKFNKLVYGKGTILAWLPICSTYLLGKLTFSKSVGWLMILGMFLTVRYTKTINGIRKTFVIVPVKLYPIICNLYILTEIGLIIYAIVKYRRIKKDANNQEDEISPLPATSQANIVQQSTEIQQTVQPGIQTTFPSVGQQQVSNNGLEQQSSGVQTVFPTEMQKEQMTLQQGIQQSVENNNNLNK